MAIFETLREDWRSGSNVSSLWTSYFGSTSIVSNQLNFNLTAASAYHGFDTASNYDLTGSYVIQQLINAGNQSFTSVELYICQLIKSADTNSKLTWYLNQNNLKCYKTVGGVRTQVGSDLAYNSALHQWFRIRESAGTVYWDYSVDGFSWTNQGSELVANLFAITVMYLEFSCGNYNTEAGTTTVIFDSINIIDTNRPGNMLRSVRTGNGIAISEGAN